MTIVVVFGLELRAITSLNILNSWSVVGAFEDKATPHTIVAQMR